MRRLVPSDLLSYSEVDRVRQLSLLEVDDPGADGPAAETYFRLRHQHPVCRFEEETGDFRARKLSDFVSRTELRRREIYWEWFRPWGVEHEMGVGLDAPLTHTKVFVFARSAGRDFSERDRAVLNFLRPHLMSLYRAADARRRAGEALAVLEHTKTPVVLLEGAGRIGFATLQARQLLRRYFGTRDGLIPDELTALLREPAKGPWTVARGERTLVLELVGGALLLEEQRAAPQLTEREREILDLVAAGKTNAEVAETIWIAPGTVRKHLENIYEKLGVHTRTAAVAALNGSS
jgi:DNA-binding CsgD family transcriptional regulator